MRKTTFAIAKGWDPECVDEEDEEEDEGCRAAALASVPRRCSGRLHGGG